MIVQLTKTNILPFLRISNWKRLVLPVSYENWLFITKLISQKVLHRVDQGELGHNKKSSEYFSPILNRKLLHYKCTNPKVYV